MSRKNSSVILKNCFKNSKDFSIIYSKFSDKLKQTKKKSFLVAVSGGSDSLALTALSKFYSYKNNCKISYALIDHNLRKNSSKEANSVKNLLKKHNIVLNVIKNKKKITRNIQSEARTIRYKLLTSFCKKKDIKIILTAHNLEDQVETFFIRLSRGSGLQGLSSMSLSNKIERNISLVRPLLDIKKKELEKITKMIFRKFFKDPTNSNKKYLRTKVRTLKNYLEKSGIKYDQIFKSINNLASSKDTLNFYFNEIYRSTVREKKTKILINLKSFNELNNEMKMKLLKKIILITNKAYYSPRSKKVVNLIEALKSHNKLNYNLSGCNFTREKHHIILKKLKKIS